MSGTKIRLITKEYFEECESAFNFLNSLIDRDEKDYEFDDKTLTESVYKLRDAVKHFEKETGYTLLIGIILKEKI